MQALQMARLKCMQEAGAYRKIVNSPLVAQWVKNPSAMQETQVQWVGWEDLLEKVMATHSSILAWEIPWTGEPGGPRSVGQTQLSD